MNKKIDIKDEKAMMEFGGKIADQFPNGGIVFLHGDLGAGKTTLVRGLLRHLGFEGIVKSPTYTLVEPYQIETKKKSEPSVSETTLEQSDDDPKGEQSESKSGGVLSTRTIYHFDLYRLGDPEELEYIGGRDYWQGDSLCLIEWPEKAEGYLPKANLEVLINYNGNARIIEKINRE